MFMEKIIVSNDNWNGAVVTYTPEEELKIECKVKGFEAKWFDIPSDYMFEDVPEGYVSPIQEKKGFFASLFGV